MVNLHVTIDSHGPHQCLSINVALNAVKENFQASLIPDLTYIHESTVCSTGINIVAVEHKTNNNYVLRYSYAWSLFNGCMGLDEDGVNTASVHFTVNNLGFVVFDLSIFQKP